MLEGTNGYIGIDETAPIRKLTVVGGSGPDAAIMVHMDADTAGGVCSLEFKADSTNDDRRIKGAVIFRRDDPGTRGTGSLGLCVNGVNSDTNVSWSDAKLTVLTSGDIVTGSKTAINQTTTGGLDIRPSGTVLRGDFSVADNEFVIWGNYGSPAGTASMQFRYDNSAKGSIGLTSSAVSFNTSSDYRLKENVDYTWDATTRLKQLKPARFNWIEDDTNTLIDGFLAHEVSSIVPEAIHGEKDAVYSVGHELEGEMKGQEMDHSKLVPLLVKTIQELEARLTVLEG
jgi:hypothetical protein